LSIYNRWGQRVFYTEDIYDGWNGKFNGINQDVGTYYYMMFYSLEGKRHMMKGDLELIR
jgi:gliding motility-associated-like protein